NLTNGVYQLEWRVENGVCATSFDTVRITLIAPPSKAFAGIDRELCLQDTVQLQPQIPHVGNGTWRILQSPNSPLIENNVLKNLTNGVYQLEWRVENGVCATSFDTVRITLIAPPSKAFAGIDRELCLQDTVQLQPQIPHVGNGTWRILQSPNSPLIENNVLKNLTNGVYQLEWRVENGVCGASLDTVNFTFLAPIVNELAISDTLVCSTAFFTVENKALSGGNGIYSITWYVNNNGNGWNKIADSSISLSRQMNGERLAFRREVVSSSCTSVTQTTFIRPIIILENTLNGDQSICIGQTAKKIAGKLRSNHSNPSINFYWQYRTSEYAEWQWIQGANDSFYIPAGLTQSTFYRRAINLNGCIDTIFSNPVFVKVFDVLQSKIKASQANVCINQILDSNIIINLTNQESFATFKWFANGKLLGQNSAFPSTKVSFSDTLLVVLETTDLRGCGNSRDSTIIVVKPLPSVSLQFQQLNDCSPTKMIFSPVVQHANQLIWNWGDGSNLDTTSVTNFEKIFFTNSSRIFSVQLTAANDCGIDTTSVSFAIQPNLTRVVLQLMGVDKKGCVPFTSFWKNRSVGVQSFVWDFGDGSKRVINGQQDTIFHRYGAAGKYEVKVIAQTTCGDTLIREFLYVFAKPNLEFSFTPQTGCVGDTVFFNNKSDQHLQFQWRFPNGSIQSGYNTKYIFREPGQFPVTLIGYQEYDDGIRCSDSVQYIVPVVSGLPGTINLSDTTVYCAPFTFTFQQFNTVAKQTVWDFGSGLKDTGTVVSHTYQQTGNYTTRMMAITDGGCVYEREIRIQIIAPEGQLEASATTLCNSQELKLFVNGKHVSKYEWNDGLGNTFITTNPSINFKYSQAGLYHPSVSLLNEAGCRVPLKINMPIQVQKIKADFLVTQKAICDTVQLKFENKTNSNAALQYAWQFNSSASSFVQIPDALVVTQSGIQSIQMIAKDEFGCADTVLQNVPVRVYKKPIVQVNDVKDICVGDVQQVELLIQADTTIQSVAWRLNGQIKISDTIFKSVFLSPGSQIIQANISTATGCTVEVERQFLVRPLPNIRVQGDTVVCKEQAVQVQARGGDTYRWLSASTVSCIDCATTLAFPSASGFLKVRGIDQWGCSANDSIYIHVAQPIQIQSKDIAFCEGGSGQIGVTGAQRYAWLPTQGLGNPTASQTSVRVNRSSTFQVIGYDRWGCYTDTSRVQVIVQPKPRIVMKRDSIVAAGSQVVLRAQINSQSPVETVRWSPGASLSCTNCFEPIATVRTDQTYQVTVTNRDGCEQTDSIRFRTICTQAQLYIPNTFTPDGDGLNDRLIVRGTQITKVLSFTIFNRWGAVVFRQQNFAPNDPSFGWDGTINGKKADADVFVVLCEFLCENDRKVLYKGNVALIR
ncbi:MAG: PKD domain-containing protein, partial [Hydrotalea sp.]|nr:PKD domain-containing protein [Hydrotalea sp.]